MSDPAIQTFCCHHSNFSNITMAIMNEFNTETYNCICLFSSTLGILGALYQILPREQFSKIHRWLSFSASRGRKIIIWLAIADLLASIGVFVKSIVWMKNESIMPAIDDGSSVLFCVISSAWTQYFYIATWIWTLCYAIDMKLVLSERELSLLFYHMAAWIVPAFLTAAGLCPLYLPNANCHAYRSLQETVVHILPNYFATYVPMVAVMVANPLLYHYSAVSMRNLIMCTAGQFTTRERELMEAVKIKFSAINLVFYICWLPNLINGVLIWTLWLNLPVTVITNFWYLMAFTNPLQALFNSLVYRKWSNNSEKIITPWNKINAPEMEEDTTPTSQVQSFEESVPLLQSLNRRSRPTINGYSTLR